jgi:hypothetical protein
MPRPRKADAAVTPPPAGPTPPPAAPAWRAWLVQLALPLAAGSALLAGLVMLGARARDALRQQGACTAAFAELECEPPPGLTRAEFLDEVQYLAHLPDRLDLLEEDWCGRVAAALALHPWVGAVRRVERRPGGRMRAVLAYRTPVLVVAGAGRAVDAAGVLLPQSAPQEGLPVLRSAVPDPAGGPGRRWGDPSVEGSAMVAGLLGPHLAALGLRGCLLEVQGGRLVLQTPAARVVWGRLPGRERPGEATAAQKLRRLLDGPALTGQEHDLRPAGGVKRRRLE